MATTEGRTGAESVPKWNAKDTTAFQTETFKPKLNRYSALSSARPAYFYGSAHLNGSAGGETGLLHAEGLSNFVNNRVRADGV